MTKFNSDDYLHGDSLIADYQGSISICGNEITFLNLEFDEEVKIHINNLVLCKCHSGQVMNFHFYYFLFTILEIEEVDSLRQVAIFDWV